MKTRPGDEYFSGGQPVATFCYHDIKYLMHEIHRVEDSGHKLLSVCNIAAGDNTGYVAFIRRRENHPNEE